MYFEPFSPTLNRFEKKFSSQHSPLRLPDLLLLWEHLEWIAVLDLIVNKSSQILPFA
jgi:hypothetical protein